MDYDNAGFSLSFHDFLLQLGGNPLQGGGIFAILNGIKSNGNSAIEELYFDVRHMNH